MSLSQGLYGKYCNGNGNHDDYQYYDDNDDGEEDNDKGSCTYYVIADGGGISPNDYSITQGWSSK